MGRRKRRETPSQSTPDLQWLEDGFKLIFTMLAYSVVSIAYGVGLIGYGIYRAWKSKAGEKNE